MISASAVRPTLPASDLARARKFYEETLGLKVMEENEGGILFDVAGGTALGVYPSGFAGTNQATAAEFEVTDLASEMKDLRSRAVKFEEYDLPGIKTVDGVWSFGKDKGAWFKDTEGNILSLVERG
jgi:catechol 2,3-dioxygenase-like lactoylglutathione lyase family enzyme